MKKLFLITGLKGRAGTQNARYVCDRHSECFTYDNTEGKSIDTMLEEDYLSNISSVSEEMTCPRLGDVK